MPAYNIQDIRNDFIFRSERVTHVLLPYVNAFYADADSASHGVFEPLRWKLRWAKAIWAKDTEPSLEWLYLLL